MLTQPGEETDTCFNCKGWKVVSVFDCFYCYGCMRDVKDCYCNEFPIPQSGPRTKLITCPTCKGSGERNPFQVGFMF